MKRLLLAGVLAPTLLLALAARAQPLAAPSTDETLRLIRATRHLDNLKSFAAMSARVFAARNKGSDAETAALWRVVAKADLSDARGCLVALYGAQGFSRADVEEVASFFESPLGKKVVETSQAKVLADLERAVATGAKPEPVSPDDFTLRELRALNEFRETSSYKKFVLATMTRPFAEASLKCIIETEAVRRAGYTWERLMNGN